MRVYEKERSEPDKSLGKKPKDRTVPELLEKGVVIIDKPVGPTSRDVCDHVEKTLNASKAGHGGTLDPKVSGVLPIAIGRATRLLDTALKDKKEYVGLMELHGDKTLEEVEKAFKTFEGDIDQKPPVKSAVKRKERERTIYSLESIEKNGRKVLFKVSCQSGTYVRKLCHQIGEELEVGAHMTRLRRTKSSGFTEEEAVTLQELEEAAEKWAEGDEKLMKEVIQPCEILVEKLPKIWVHDTAVESLCHGHDLAIPGVSRLTDFQEGESVALMTLKNELIGIGIANMSGELILGSEEGIAVEINKVFMNPELYSK